MRKKTHFIVFTNKRKTCHQLKIIMEGEVLQEVSSTKFLEVIIDKKLTWKEHITYINSKISKGMGMLIRARNYLNKDGLIALYNSFVFPYFTYCNHIWGSTYKSNLSKLCVLQNKIVRIISHAKPRQSAQPLYHHLGIMPLLHINKYVIGRFMYRYCTGRVPDIYSDFFKKNSEFYEYETRSADLFHIPPVSLDLGKTGIRYLGVIIWNSILKNGVNSEISEGIFAKRLKKMVHNNSLSVAVWFWLICTMFN